MKEEISIIDRRLEQKIGFDRIRQIISDRCSTSYASERTAEERFCSDAAEIRRQAQEEAQKLVSQEAVYNEARQAANDMVRAAQDKTKELIEVARSYVDDSLRKTEEAVAQALAEVRDMRNAYRAVSKPQARTESPIIEEV